MLVKVKKLSPDAVIPEYATPGSAGFDLVAIETISLRPGETRLVKTGLSMEIPPGFELQVRPRSGTSLKTHLRVANAPGTVDSDYRGEVCVIITHSGQRGDIFGNGHTDLDIEIAKGTRIAQGVVAPVMQAIFEVVDELSDTSRGAGGFGSTGK